MGDNVPGLEVVVGVWLRGDYIAVAAGLNLGNKKALYFYKASLFTKWIF